MNHHVTYKIESLTPDGWDAHLFFGEPSYESDIAWNKLIRRKATSFFPPFHPDLLLKRGPDR